MEGLAMSLDNETPEKRKEIAKKGGQARWLRKATHEGEITIMGKKLPCVVLDDGSRILTSSAVYTALDRPARGSRVKDDSGSKLVPSFMDAKNLQPFVSDEDRKNLKTVEYQSLSKVKSVGYSAEAVVIVSNIYLEAREAGVLAPSQVRTAKTSELLVRSLSKVGITALVDEATGYQSCRPMNALQAYLDKILSRELAEWSRVFPLEFYENIYRLKKWGWESGKKQYYSCVGMYTNNLIYSLLGEGVLEELKKRTPKSEAGNPSNKLHQWFNTSTGSQMLGKHIHGVVTLQRLALAQGFGWSRFLDMVDAALPVPEPIIDESIKDAV